LNGKKDGHNQCVVQYAQLDESHSTLDISEPSQLAEEDEILAKSRLDRDGSYHDNAGGAAGWIPME
jgi:hypothetical protein